MIRAKARTAAKRQQKELIEKAKRMRDDPALVLPTCDGSHGPCPFLKLVDKLERIASFARRSLRNWQGGATFWQELMQERYFSPRRRKLPIWES